MPKKSFYIIIILKLPYFVVARARRKITDSNNEVKDAEVTENGEPSPLDKSINNSDNTVETSTKSVIGTAEDATEEKR